MLGIRRVGVLAAVAVAAVALAAVGLAACSRPAPKPGPQIELISAEVTEPNASGTTEAYVEVQNKGPADKLIAARVSVGGHVTLRSPAADGAMLMRSVPSIGIPADSFTRLTPYSSHLLITDSGRMKAGTEITLTLVFAHAGSISTAAMVTNPQTGGSSYFLN